MNEEQNREENGWQTEGESLNTGSAENASNTGNKQTEGQPHKGGIHNNALYAASMGRPATAQVSRHSDAGLAQTGTNTSYEGPTAPGAGGAAGNGYTSGQSGVETSISTSSDYDQARVEKDNTSNKPDNEAEDDARNTLI